MTFPEGNRPPQQDLSPDNHEAWRDTQRASLERLPDPVRNLYERARMLVTNPEPGIDIYPVDTDRFFDETLPAKGMIPVLEGYVTSGEVFVGKTDQEDLPVLSWIVNLETRAGEYEMISLVTLSSRGLKVKLYRDEKWGWLVIGKEKAGLPQESEEAVLFAEALLETIEGQESVRITLPMGEGDVGLSSFSDEKRRRLADYITEVVKQFGPVNDPRTTLGHTIIVE